MGLLSAAVTSSTPELLGSTRLPRQSNGLNFILETFASGLVGNASFLFTSKNGGTRTYKIALDPTFHDFGMLISGHLTLTDTGI